MKKVSKQMSMEISGGHTVVAYPRNGPDNEYEASKPGVAEMCIRDRSSREQQRRKSKQPKTVTFGINEWLKLAS